MIGQEVISLGERFRGRLDDMHLDFALDYVGYNETPLAFETLCDYLEEQDISLSLDEYNEIVRVSNVLGVALYPGVAKSLRDNVIVPEE